MLKIHASVTFHTTQSSNYISFAKCEMFLRAPPRAMAIRWTLSF